jgi:hypothetical protein
MSRRVGRDLVRAELPPALGMTDATEPGMLATRRPRDVPKERSCLRCGTAFLSEWSGERVCRHCKGSAVWRAGIPDSATWSRRA